MPPTGPQRGARGRADAAGGRAGSAAARQAEERFVALAEGVAEVVARFAPDLRCLYVNPAIERFTGRPAAGFVGRTSREAGMPEEAATAWETALRRVLASGLAEGVELALPAPEGTRRFAVRLVPESAPHGAVQAVLAVARDVTDRRLADESERLRIAKALASQAAVAVDNAALYEQMQTSQARLQALARRLVEAQERERRHVARELHDEAGQALASLRFGLQLLERQVGEGAAVSARVAELMRTTDAVIDGLHRLAADLRPASLDHLGLDAALRQFARSAAVKFGLAIRFKARGFTGERLPPVVETALFRVVQEAVTNVVRHARASRVDVLVEHRGARVVAMVEDDGVGFDPEAVQSGEHFGLLGLRERAEALDGSLTIESAPGAGTTVVVEVASADPHPDR